MMQVQEVSKEGLSHVWTIKVPQDIVNKAIEVRLVEVGKTANIQGFRPGKVPMTLVKQRYGERVRSEVLEETVSKCVQDAMTEKKIRPAVQPRVEDVSAEEGKDLEFKLSVESLPDVTLSDFSTITLERPVVTPSEEKVIEALTQAAKRTRKPTVMTEKRAIQMGDVALINFDGSVDGERQEGMKGEDFDLELGSKSFIDTFEEQIVGMKVGDKKDIKVTFPADYHATHLANKEAVFAVELKEIRAHKPLELDDDLAKELGFSSMEECKKNVVEQLTGMYAKAARNVIKRKLLDQLEETYHFEVPKSLLEREFASIWHQIEHMKKDGSLPEDEKNKSDAELKADYQKIAERRLRLGLVLAEVSSQNKITVGENELRMAMYAEARRFPGQEKMVFDYFTKNAEAVERLHAPILEEKTVDFILSKAKVSDKSVAADELLKMQQEDDDA